MNYYGFLVIHMCNIVLTLQMVPFMSQFYAKSSFVLAISFTTQFKLEIISKF